MKKIVKLPLGQGFGPFDAFFQNLIKKMTGTTKKNRSRI